MMTNTVLLIGRPGSGKGTQAKMLTEKFGWELFSTGTLFKELRDSDTVLGTCVREAYDAGKLLPDWFATYLFEDTMLKLESEKGILCEGYPRSSAQAEIFHDTMTWLARPYRVFDLQVSEEETMRRMLERSLTEHRPDSATPEQIRARFETYEANTAPILGFFKEKGMLAEINGEQTPDKVFTSLTEALSS